MPKKDDEKCPCICKIEPSKCQISVEWRDKVDEVGSVEIMIELGENSFVPAKLNYVMFGAAALVTLKHSEGKSVSGCHLHQEATQAGTFNDADVSNSNPDDFTKEKDAKNDYYGGTWLFDAPSVRWVNASSKQTVFNMMFEAHVYVEEAKSVETHWGYAGMIEEWQKGEWKAKTKYDRWKD